MLRELDGPASENMAPSHDRGPLGQPHLLLAATRNTLGLMFLDLEAVDLAIAEFTRVLELTGDDDPVLDGIARGNPASAYLRKALRRRTSDGRIEGADNELASAERLAREVLASDAPPRRLIEAASVLVAALLYTEQLDEAAVLLRAHREHEHLVDDPRAMVDWNLLWARSHRGDGQFDEALERVERSIELAERSGDRITVSLARRERSRVHEAICAVRSTISASPTITRASSAPGGSRPSSNSSSAGRASRRRGAGSGARPSTSAPNVIACCWRARPIR